jgi:hypothetical protein
LEQGAIEQRDIAVKQEEGKEMRADRALSHLYDDELCIVVMKDGTTHKVRWSKPNWRFFYTDRPTPTICDFDDIEEWRLASIKF